MTKQEIIDQLIAKGYNNDASATQQDLYTTIERGQLFSKSNRLNAGWARGKYLVASFDETRYSLQEYVEQWKTKVSRYQNQFLCLEINNNEWKFFDYSGKQISFVVNPPQLELAGAYLAIKKAPLDYPLQQIFYGAPGTGKSHRITDDDGVKKADENNLVFRTTFHPDSDYSTFVGCYKPTMDEDGGSGEEKIVYRFNPQVFTDAYIAAWRTDEDVYLIIEEINRGNCAQIFGDLFQLLDRDGEGYSKYEIKPDVDLTKYIAGCKLDISGVKNSNGNDISKKIASGEVLKLPKNLYIWATMNTSDQSLFPIDSAFKRRWDWEYIPIDYNCPESNYTIIVDDEHKYSWPEFLKNVNDLIYDTAKSEDKQMGNFFLSNVKGKEIGCDQFVSKVMFYLWNDICKDNPKAKKSIYSWKLEEPEEGKEDMREFKFSDLFPAGEERNKLLIGFMSNLEVKNIAESKDKE